MISDIALNIEANHLHRIMGGCDGSLKLTNGRSGPPPSDATREGLAAHAAFRRIVDGHDKPNDLIGHTVMIDADQSTFVITREIIDNIMSAVDHVKARGGNILTETKTDWSPLADRGRINGRADLIACDNIGGVLYVDDLKYGFRLVDVERNWALISHAIGFITGSQSKHFNKIVFTIFQPRPYHPDGNIRTWSITAADLLAYKAIIQGTFAEYHDRLVTGQHCYKCLAAAICPALRSASMNALDVVSTAFDDSLTGDELAFELDLMDRAETIIKIRSKALDEHARAEIMAQRRVGNYDMAPGLGNRRWNDGVTAEMILSLTGVDINEKPELMTPAAAERAGVGKDITPLFTHRPQTEFKLRKRDLDKEARRAFQK